MKKFIVVAALVLTTGVLASQTKSNSTVRITQPGIPKSTLSTDSKELASGD
jgi:ABC-type proline/glycine betaine transport system substrate-binding protein